MFIWNGIDYIDYDKIRTVRDYNTQYPQKTG